MTFQLKKAEMGETKGIEEYVWVLRLEILPDHCDIYYWYYTL